MRSFAEKGLGDVAPTELLETLLQSGKAVNGNDLSQAEQVLNAQALTLNLMFTELSTRAALNIGANMGAVEIYLRLALKAQAQSRATFETLATIKAPPVLFARQANINNGGQQQVNNGSSPVAGSVPAHASDPKTTPTELLEQPHGEWLDTGATRTAGRNDPHLAPLGEVNRPSDSRGQGSDGAQRVQRRPAGEVASASAHRGKGTPGPA